VATDELVAAIAALSRRIIPEAPDLSNALLLNMTSLILQGASDEVSITYSEAAILTALARAPGQRLDYCQIAKAIGKSPETLSKNSLESRILRLRKKMIEVGGETAEIKSIRLLGYQLCVPLHIST
jgi:DNA-binding response OmpR family regulator